jgi:protein-S-isoprenylcysteine O-methyltransferase Ste14
MFAAAGTWDWPAGWAYFALALVAILGSRLIVARRMPSLLRERARFTEAEGAMTWDRVLSPIVGLVGPLLIGVVAGIDHRLAWGPPIPLAVRIIAGAVVAAGFALSSWAMVSNRFFSAVVRIQKERGHEVVTSGPYRFVRHPSYAGGVVAYLALPLMLDALWVMVPALLVLAALVVRTALEDRTLLESLPGYPEYAARTRSRLIPGIW